MDSKKNRPKPKPLDRTSLEWGLEFISLAGILLVILSTLWFYRELPDKIPINFNLKGEPNGYGSKSFIWIINGVAVIIVAMLQSVIKIPDQYNYPLKVTAENAQALYRLTQHHLIWIKAIVALIFLGLTVLIIQFALNPQSPRWTFGFVAISLVAISIVVYRLVQSSRKLKKKSPVE